MAQPFLGQIIMFGGNFVPRGYAGCNGQLIAISQNDALFALIGTTYGGDGQTTFGIPDLRGRIPLNQGNSTTGSQYSLGQMAGTETVTVISTQMPIHNHTFPGNSNSGTVPSPNGGVVASTQLNPYVQAAPADTPMGNQMIGQAGGNQPHENMMPFLCVTFIIAVEGVFPTRN